MKPPRLRDHLERMHADKKDKPISYFRSLKEQFEKRQRSFSAVLTRPSDSLSDGTIASYNIAALVAKNLKPHTIEESLLRPAISEVINTVLHKDAVSVGVIYDLLSCVA